ncbi:TPA: hypothetical protein NDU23_004710 [Escherichia coli]|nr:hypothetical protein [Escherichia coli]
MTDQASIPVDTPVLALATDAYSSLKNILNDNGTSDTTGTCMFASLLVCEFAHRRGMSAAVRGGNGTDDGGIFNESGGHGHYWCEVSAGEMIFYIDIAAEQFGYPSFIIKSGWPRYIPGDQVTVDEHVRITLSGGIR